MKIALDPYMHRHLDLPGICRLTAELGYEYIELSPRADFLEWWSMPRVYPERIQAFKQAMTDHGVKLATLQPMYTRQRAELSRPLACAVNKNFAFDFTTRS